MNKTAIAAAIMLAATTAQANHWTTSGHVARANAGAPVVFGVTFDYSRNCDEAQLILYGNAEVTAMGLVVDGQNYGAVETFDAGDSLMVVVAGPAALKAIKDGRTAAVVTDQGTLSVGLSGSAAALNAAYAGCLAIIAEAEARAVRPLMPSRPQEESHSVSF